MMKKIFAFFYLFLTVGIFLSPATASSRDEENRILSIFAENFSISLSPDGDSIDVFEALDVNVVIYEYKQLPDGLSFHVLLEDPYFGSVQAVVINSEKSIKFEKIRGDLFGGTFEGDVFIEKGLWSKTLISIKWENVNLNNLRKWWPPAQENFGLCSGFFELKPSQMQRSYEPLSFESEILFKGDIFDRMGAEKIVFEGAVGTDRLLFTKMEMALFDGLAKIKSRISKRPKGEHFIYANTSFEDVNIEKAQDFFSKENGEIEGRLNGSGYVVSNLGMDHMSGSLDLMLEESNLSGNKVIGTLYNVLNLKSKAEPEGYGRVSMRLSGVELVISEFYYFNRGVEMRGTGVVKNLQLGSQSPVEGVVLASTRPLKEIELPGIETLDKMLFFAQKEATAVEVGGSIEDIKVELRLLPQIQATLKKLLGGD